MLIGGMPYRDCYQWVIGGLIIGSLLIAEGCGWRRSGKELVEKHCTECHTLFPIEAAHKTSREWRITVSRMKRYGVRMNNRRTQKLIEYLSRTYGPKAP